MALTSNFDLLIKEYMPNELLINEIEKNNWFINKLKKDTEWGLGAYSIPVETQEYSRFEFGSLPAANDIPGASYAKPQVSAPKQLLGSLLFDNADLERHSGDMKKSFLKVMPDKVKQFISRMSELASIALLTDGSIAPVVANGTVGGLISVGKKIAYMTNGMKVNVRNTTPATVTGYVRNIDVSAGTFTLATAASGAVTGVDSSAMTTALSAKVFLPNGGAERFTSLIDIVFPASMGGQDTLYGGALVKSASPVFQPYTVDISSATTATAFIAALYDFYFDNEELGRGVAEEKEVLVPYHVFKSIVKNLETNRRFTTEDAGTFFGASTIYLTGPAGKMKITAVRGFAPDKIVAMDWSAMKLCSRGELIKKANSLGGESFEVRNTTGYQYLVDKKLEAELIVNNPKALAGAKIATALT